MVLDGRKPLHLSRRHWRGGGGRPCRPDGMIRPAIDPLAGDGVARQSGFGAGQHAFVAQQAVDDGRLADIGPADDGQVQRPRRFRLLGFDVDVAVFDIIVASGV